VEFDEHTDHPKCTNCNQLLSVKHVLTECTSYDQTWHQLTLKTSSIIRPVKIY